jgi:H+/gluconate symporter-like permease
MLFGLLGILAGLGLLIWLSYRGWSVLLLAPAAALVAAGAAGEPLLAHWTETFMGGAAKFLAQFFPLFLLGALFGKMMDDSGSVETIAGFMTEKLGTARAILAVTLAGAIVTYGGVSLFVAFFVLVPMAQSLFKAADIPHRLVPASIALGTMTFTMSALPGTPALQNAIPMPFFGTTPFAAPGLGIIAAAIMLGLGLWWLNRAEGAARRAGEGYGKYEPVDVPAQEQSARERATIASEFDPAEITHGRHAAGAPSVLAAFLPLIVVILVNLAMSLFVLPRLDTSYLAEARWGGTSLAAVGGVWAVVVALFAAILTLIAALPAFALVRDWVLSIGGGPLVSLAVATNILAALTGSASGGLTIALDALGETYLRLASEHGIDLALLHRVAVMSAGNLDSLPHNGAVVTLLAVCGMTHRDSYKDLFVVAIVGALVALAAVIVLGSIFGSF